MFYLCSNGESRWNEESEMKISRNITTALGAGLGILAAAAALASETISYGYDVHGRLVKVERTDLDNGVVVSNIVSNYAYDKADNLTNKTVSGAP